MEDRSSAQEGSYICYSSNSLDGPTVRTRSCCLSSLWSHQVAYYGTVAHFDLFLSFVPHLLCLGWAVASILYTNLAYSSIYFLVFGNFRSLYLCALFSVTIFPFKLLTKYPLFFLLLLFGFLRLPSWIFLFLVYLLALSKKVSYFFFLILRGSVPAILRWFLLANCL